MSPFFFFTICKLFIIGKSDRLIIWQFVNSNLIKFGLVNKSGLKNAMFGTFKFVADA